MTTINKNSRVIKEPPKILPDGLVKLDGVAIFRKVYHDGILHLQFIDNDRMRAACRGSRYVEISLEALIDAVGDKTKDKADEPITASPVNQH